MIGWIKEHCGLDPPLSESRKIRTLKFERRFATDQQGISSYLLPVGETAENIVKNLYYKTAALQFSTRAKKLSKLSLPMITKMGRYYRFQGDQASQFLLLPQCITDLSGLLRTFPGWMLPSLSQRWRKGRLHQGLCWR